MFAHAIKNATGHAVSRLREYGGPSRHHWFVVYSPTRCLIRVDDEDGNVIETHEHKGDFKEL
jgi:hypothetical protein